MTGLRLARHALDGVVTAFFAIGVVLAVSHVGSATCGTVLSEARRTASEKAARRAQWDAGHQPATPEQEARLAQDEAEAEAAHRASIPTTPAEKVARHAAWKAQHRSAVQAEVPVGHCAPGFQWDAHQDTCIREDVIKIDCEGYPELGRNASHVVVVFISQDGVHDEFETIELDSLCGPATPKGDGLNEQAEIAAETGEAPSDGAGDGPVNDWSLSHREVPTTPAEDCVVGVDVPQFIVICGVDGEWWMRPLHDAEPTAAELADAPEGARCAVYDLQAMESPMVFLTHPVSEYEEDFVLPEEP